MSEMHQTMRRIVMAPTVLPEARPIEYLEAAAAAGFQEIGLRLHRSLVMPFHPVVGDEALIARIRSLLRDSGLKMFEVTSFYLAPEMEFDSYEAAMALGAELGASNALIIASDREWSRLVENFGRLCEIAARHGLTCAVENAPNGGLPTANAIARLIEETGVANGAICLDPINHFTAGGTLDDLRALPARYFPYTQIADALIHEGVVEIVDGRQKHIPRRLFGEGNMDLFGLLDALPAGIPISPELPPAAQPAGEPPMSPNQWAARVRAATEKLALDYEERRAAAE